MNVITLLKNDHRKVERLFQRYRSATKSRKRGLVAQITSELSMHMNAEERELYPVLRTSLPDGPRLMEEANTEHREARGLLAEVQNADVESFDTDAKMATLQAAIDHHVKEEEGEIFPQMTRVILKSQIEQLGLEIAKAKKSAPRRPSRSATRRSPGASITGVVSAAVDRMAKTLTGSGDASTKVSPRRARSRKKATSRKTSGRRASAKRSGKRIVRSRKAKTARR